MSAGGGEMCPRLVPLSSSLGGQCPPGCGRDSEPRRRLLHVAGVAANWDLPRDRSKLLLRSECFGTQRPLRCGCVPASWPRSDNGEMGGAGRGANTLSGTRVSTAIPAPLSICQDLRAVRRCQGAPGWGGGRGRQAGSQPGVLLKALLAERGRVAGSVPQGAQPDPPSGSIVLCDGCSQLGPAQPSAPSSLGCPCW